MRNKVKEILIGNLNSRNFAMLESVIRDYKLFGSTVIVPPEQFNSEVAKLSVKYGITFAVPVTSTDERPGSIMEIEKINPGFKDAIYAHPASKLAFLYTIDPDDEEAMAGLITIGAEFPNNRLLVTAIPGKEPAFCSVKEMVQNLILSVDDFKELRPIFIATLHEQYDVLDYGFLASIGLIKV